MKEVKDNDVYLTLDDKKSDEFILKQNLDALRNTKNIEMTRITQDLVSIPATLVRLKWQNRREIYPLQVKEEIYGAVINSLIEQQPELKEKLLGRLEANYQYLLAREVATLRLTRKLSAGEYRTSNVTCVALDEDTLATSSAAQTDNKKRITDSIKKAGFASSYYFWPLSLRRPAQSSDNPPDAACPSPSSWFRSRRFCPHGRRRWCLSCRRLADPAPE